MTPLTRFVLVRPSHAGNVGAAARALKVMGFDDLVVVAPRQADVLGSEEACARASGAVDVLQRARSVERLVDALDGIGQAWATAMTPRDFGPPTHAPRQGLPGVAASGQSVAFVFGEERIGLTNEDLYRCHGVLSIPTAPGYGSLNLAQSVQLIAYEWREALGGFPVVPRAPVEPVADLPSVLGAVDHWQRVLERIGFLDPAAPKKLMPRLTALLHRAALRPSEVHILRGVARAVERQAEASPHAAPVRPPAPEG